MPKIKLEHIVSCSSEDPDHAANNLLNIETKKKWKNKTIGEISASIIVQIEKASKISGIDIGNENSSFIEVLVGRSISQDQDYKIILAMSSFMTPMDARNVTNCNRVRMFTYDDLATSVRDEKWDRIKVVCTQPFNKHIQYGLSFITLHTPNENKEDVSNTTLGKFALRPESPVETVGSLFAKRKELVEQNNSEHKITTVQAMKTSDTSKYKPVNFQLFSNKKTPINDTEEKNRNRKNLFYDSDDDVPNEKIDNVIEKLKQDEKKKTPNKAKDSPKPSSSKQDQISAKYSTFISKRKPDISLKTSNKKRKLITKPFNQLLSGVIFTISGIVNPERANLRSFAMNMGAKYKPDWDNSCTHLICAFANTPKFNQVRGKGKIVTKLWIKDCHDKRKRLPWRRYALDKNDQRKTESEEEINEEIQKREISDSLFEDKTDVEDSKTHHLFDSDTDDEIEKVLQQQTVESKTVHTNKDPFDADTDEEILEKNPAKVKERIPNIFKTEIFYIEDDFDEEEKNKLQRLIKALDGVILTSLRNIVDYVITTEDFMQHKEDINSNFKYINYLWIYECHNTLKRVPYEKFQL